MKPANFDTPILHKILVKAALKRVFEAITTSSGLDGWFTKGSKVDLRPEGLMTFRWENWGPDKVNYTVECPIDEVVTSKRFVFR